MRYSPGILLRLLFFTGLALPLRAGEISRAEVIAVAKSFAEYSWDARPANVLQGKDPAGVEVLTPSAPAAEGAPPGYWIVGQTNLGMPYKWGGFDSLASFAAGVRAGKAAGDLYNPGKRIKADAAVSQYAVGSIVPASFPAAGSSRRNTARRHCPISARHWGARKN